MDYVVVGLVGNGEDMEFDAATREEADAIASGLDAATVYTAAEYAALTHVR